MTIPTKVKKSMEDLLEKYKSNAFKLTGYDQEGGGDIGVVFPNPQATRKCGDDCDELTQALYDHYGGDDCDDECIDYNIEVQRIKRKDKQHPELKVKLGVSRSWTDYDEGESMSDEYDIDEYEPEGNFQKKCPAYKDMTRADKVKMLGLEYVEEYEIGTFSGSGDSGDFMPTGGTVGNTDFQSWMRDKVESLMESSHPDFNNEGAYGHVNMSANDGVITLDLICHTGFRNDEQLEDMEAII